MHVHFLAKILYCACVDEKNNFDGKPGKTGHIYVSSTLQKHSVKKLLFWDPIVKRGLIKIGGLSCHSIKIYFTSVITPTCQQFLLHVKKSHTFSGSPEFLKVFWFFWENFLVLEKTDEKIGLFGNFFHLGAICNHLISE